MRRQPAPVPHQLQGACEHRQGAANPPAAGKRVRGAARACLRAAGRHPHARRPPATACGRKRQVGAFQGDGDDIIDEALTYYRANVLFRNYELQVCAVARRACHPRTALRTHGRADAQSDVGSRSTASPTHPLGRGRPRHHLLDPLHFRVPRSSAARAPACTVCCVHGGGDVAGAVKRLCPRNKPFSALKTISSALKPFLLPTTARLEKTEDVKSAEKVLQSYSWESLALPGE